MSHIATKADLEAFGNLMQKIGEAKAHIDQVCADRDAAEARAERYRKALEELVAAQDAAGTGSGTTAEYLKRADRANAAWDAARAALRGEG